MIISGRDVEIASAGMPLTAMARGEPLESAGS
jgi:hypothetical protein